MATKTTTAHCTVSCPTAEVKQELHSKQYTPMGLVKAAEGDFSVLDPAVITYTGIGSSSPINLAENKRLLSFLILSHGQRKTHLLYFHLKASPMGVSVFTIVLKDTTG